MGGSAANFNWFIDVLDFKPLCTIWRGMSAFCVWLSFLKLAFGLFYILFRRGVLFRMGFSRFSVFTVFVNFARVWRHLLLSCRVGHEGLGAQIDGF